MPGPGTIFNPGPVQSGSLPNGSDLGLVILEQAVSITQNGTASVSGTITIPPSSKIIDILADTTTVWNSGSTDVLSVGTAAAGTTFASGVSTASTGRVRPTFTAAQLLAMQTAGPTIVATITPTGTAATTGLTTVTLIYAQTVQSTLGSS